MQPTKPPVFDGHNDVLTKLLGAGGLSAVGEFISGREGDVDIPRAKSGGFSGGFFAIWVPSPIDADTRYDAMAEASYDLPLPAPVPQSEAMNVVMAEAAILLELERQGALKICRSVSEIKQAMQNGKMAAIFHIEGAEAIGPELYELDVLYAAGLRSIGPVWSRNNIFANGVPFRYPSSPDIGGGLTEPGRALIQRCDELGIMIDLSHLNEAGFWDIAGLSQKPLVASHSNAHAICPHSRNLTDEQLKAIKNSDGLVGLNFAAAFLREDGRMIADTPIECALQHLDHLIAHLGEDRVALGSDYDGAVCPEALTGAQTLPALRQAMADHGYDESLIAKICHKNWLRVLEKIWGS